MVSARRSVSSALRIKAVSLFLAVCAMALSVGALAATAASAETTRLISTGAQNGNAAEDNNPGGTIADGTTYFFNTRASLTANDTDSGANDAYARTGAITTLISTGSSNPNSADDAEYSGTSAGGSKVFFSTTASLSAGDTDGGEYDVYMRSGGTTTLISSGPLNANDAVGSYFNGASSDGSSVFFSTFSSLTADDTDGGAFDVYLRSGSTTTLVSTTAIIAAANTPDDAYFIANSANGNKVLLDSSADLTADDGDGIRDAFLRNITAETITLESVGSQTPGVQTGGEGYGLSADGDKVVFNTYESLEPSDDDGGQQDVYVRDDDTTTLVSTGPDNADSGDAAYASAFSSNGEVIAFTTTAALTSGDTDGGYSDGYLRTGETTSLATTGSQNANDPVDMNVDSLTKDGSKAFFMTDTAIKSADSDAAFDVYMRDGTSTKLISTATQNSNGPENATVAGSANDGSRVFFVTYGALASDDTDDSYQDIYERDFGPDPVGEQPAQAPPTSATDTSVPAIGALKLSNKRFAVDTKGKAVTPAAAIAAAKLGTTISFTSSESARVGFSVLELKTGRLAGRSCIKQSSKNRRKKKCLRASHIASFAANANAGANSLSFAGKIGGKSLKPGDYKLQLMAVDGSGNKSAAASVTFTVVKK